MKEIINVEVIISDIDKKKKLQVTFSEFGIEDKKIYKPEYVVEQREMISKNIAKIDLDLSKIPQDKMFLSKIKILNNQKIDLQNKSEFIDFLENKFIENNLL